MEQYTVLNAFIAAPSLARPEIAHSNPDVAQNLGAESGMLYGWEGLTRSHLSVILQARPYY